MADTIDPLAGSYYLESLTDEIEAQAGDYLARIDDVGGALAAIEAGYIQQEIQESAYRFQRAMEAQERIVVGVNRFRVTEDRKPDLLRVEEAVQKAQTARLKRLRAKRDNDAGERALVDLRDAAEGSENLMPFILRAVESYATTGEICNTLRCVFGEHQPTTAV